MRPLQKVLMTMLTLATSRLSSPGILKKGAAPQLEVYDVPLRDSEIPEGSPEYLAIISGTTTGEGQLSQSEATALLSLSRTILGLTPNTTSRVDSGSVTV